MMGALLACSLIAALVMCTLYPVYRVLLARETRHDFNRGILLTVYLLSFLLPPLVLSWDGFGANDGAQTLEWEGAEVASTVVSGEPRPAWGSLLLWVYLAGAVVVMAKTAATWVRLLSIIRKGRKMEREEYTLVISDDERYTPFNWMRYVVISRTDYETDCSAIATHELTHLDERHRADLLLAQLACILCWYCPAAWFLRRELMLVHEYQADRAVINSGHDAQEYQMLLIRKAVGARFPSLANSLNHSKLKKRITMMQKNKSCAGQRVKALALVPALALALGVVNVPAVRAAVNTIACSRLSTGEGSEKNHEDKAAKYVFKVVEISNEDKRTAITIKVKGLDEPFGISRCTYTDRGKTYEAEPLSFHTDEEGNGVFNAFFPFFSVFASPKLALIKADGQEIPFDLAKFIHGGTAEATATLHAPVPPTVYLNGKKLSPSELQAFEEEKGPFEGTPDDKYIRFADGSRHPMVFNKKKNTVHITTK